MVHHNAVTQAASVDTTQCRHSGLLCLHTTMPSRRPPLWTHRSVITQTVYTVQVRRPSAWRTVYHLCRRAGSLQPAEPGRCRRVVAASRARAAGQRSTELRVPAAAVSRMAARVTPARLRSHLAMRKYSTAIISVMKCV